VNGRAQKFRFAPLIALVVAVLVIFGGAAWWLVNLIQGGAPPPKKVVQEIRLIRPPPEELPPPPPPPPPEEEVDVPDPQQPEPEPTPSNEPPPGELLGLDAEGTAGGDGFGLAARKGGRDLLASGGSAFTWYAGLLKNEILDRLQEEQRVRSGGAYSVPVRAWVRDDGTIERIELAQSTGDSARDEAIRKVLATISRLPQAPPPNMPQPMVLRIVSRA
jgi:periplasmic protein TonB